MHYYIDVLKKYFVFSGRSRRAEYWYFMLFNFIVLFVLGMIQFFVALSGGNPMIVSVIYWLYYLAILIPTLAVSVRRLHDIGKSGWMILINLIPIIGAIWFLVLTCFDSTEGNNEYGPNPKTSSSVNPPIAPTPTPQSNPVNPQ